MTRREVIMEAVAGKLEWYQAAEIRRHWSLWSAQNAAGAMLAAFRPDDCSLLFFWLAEVVVAGLARPAHRLDQVVDHRVVVGRCCRPNGSCTLL